MGLLRSTDALFLSPPHLKITSQWGTDIRTYLFCPSIFIQIVDLEIGEQLSNIIQLSKFCRFRRGGLLNSKSVRVPIRPYPKGGSLMSCRPWILLVIVLVQEFILFPRLDTVIAWNVGKYSSHPEPLFLHIHVLRCTKSSHQVEVKLPA